MLHTEPKIVWSSNKFKKHWSARVTDEFSSETLISRKILSSLYTKCVQFPPWPSLLRCTCYAGEMMIPCKVPTFSEFILYWFSISWSVRSLNKSVNDWKTANDVRTCWKLMTSLWMLYTEPKIVWSTNKFKKHWSARLTDEFLSETLIPQGDFPVCTRSASSFHRDPLYSVAHAMRVKWWYHAKFQHFQSSFCTDFQFHGQFAL